jgi:hypothetical protein
MAASTGTSLGERTVPLLAARVRPAHAHGRESESSSSLLRHDSGISVSTTGRTFAIDRQLWGSEAEEAWQQLGEPLVTTALSGISATLLAIGATGTGRSYTLSGNGIDVPGLVPRCLRVLCEAAASSHGMLRLELCMVEVHMDHAYDLLCPCSGGQPREPLQLSSTHIGDSVWWSPRAMGGDGHDASSGTMDCWHAIGSFEQAEALRHLGEAQRSCRPTALHERAAFGHCLTFVRLTKTPQGAGQGKLRGDDELDAEGHESNDEWQCRLCFASIGGAERVEAHGALSAAALRESLNLSASLSALSGLVPALCRREKLGGTAARINWNTPLVQLLRESLEGKAALVVLATLSPAEALTAESISTLRFLSSISTLSTSAAQHRGSALLGAVRGAAARLEDLQNMESGGGRGGALSPSGGPRPTGESGEGNNATTASDSLPPSPTTVANLSDAIDEAARELSTLRLLLDREMETWTEKLVRTAAAARRTAFSVREAGLPTAALLEAFGWSVELAELPTQHRRSVHSALSSALGSTQAQADGAHLSYEHTAHLLDLPAAASGGPIIRLPMPLPGSRVWIRGGRATPMAAGADGAGSIGGSERAESDGTLQVLGGGVSDPHAVLAVSSAGVVQLELLEESGIVVLNGDLLSTGQSFTLYHGDRLIIGHERLFHVALWKPTHDGGHTSSGAVHAYEAAAAG